MGVPGSNSVITRTRLTPYEPRAATVDAVDLDRLVITTAVFNHLVRASAPKACWQRSVFLNKFLDDKKTLPIGWDAGHGVAADLAMSLILNELWKEPKLEPVPQAAIKPVPRGAIKPVPEPEPVPVPEPELVPEPVLDLEPVPAPELEPMPTPDRETTGCVGPRGRPRGLCILM